MMADSKGMSNGEPLLQAMANEQLLRFYWSVGEDIARKKAVSKWGDVVIATMSRELSGPLESLRESSRDRASDYKSMKQYIDITESAKGYKNIFAELNTNPYLCLDFV